MRLEGRRAPQPLTPMCHEEPLADAAEPDWQRVAAMLDTLNTEPETEEFLRELAGALLGTSYEALGAAAFRDRFTVNIATMVAGLRTRRGPHPDEDETEIRRTGRLRAEGGVAASDMVRVTLVAQRILLNRVTAMGLSHGIPDGTLVEALQHLDSWMAWQMYSMLDGHREAELELAARQTRRRDRAVRRLLSGDLTPAEAAEAAGDCGLDARHVYHVLCVPTPPRTAAADVRRELSAAGLVLSDRGAHTVLYGDLCLIVSELPAGEVDLVVGASGPVSLSDLAEGFRTATRCAELGRRLKLAGVVTMRELSVLAALTVDGEVVHALRSRYIEPFERLGASGESILDTVASYLDHQRSVSATAAALYVHANTIRYRLSRFEASADCSLRHVATMAEVWWVLHSRALESA